MRVYSQPVKQQAALLKAGVELFHPTGFPPWIEVLEVKLVTVGWSRDPQVLVSGSDGKYLTSFTVDPGEIVETRQYRLLDDRYIETDAMLFLFDGAKAHGDEEGSEVEIGDLQELLKTAWKIMTPEQRAQFLRDEELVNGMFTVPEFAAVRAMLELE